MMDKRKITAESAMRDGTILGCLWTATFALSIVMLKMVVNGQGLLISFAVLVMTLMSPFVAYKLAPIEDVVSTATHFVLKKYKDKGVIYKMPEKDERECVL